MTSLPFGPVAKLARPPELPSTLVGNTGQTPAATKTFSGVYTMGFRLGSHGQGYEITGVSIDLAAVPSGLTVSMHVSGHPELPHSTARRYRLFDFKNPDSFKVGLNRFTAPEGAFAYQNINYFLVLSAHGSPVSIKETTSDNEDAGGETGATLSNDASSSGSGALRLAVEGSQRDRGILASNYAQPYDGSDMDDSGGQEIISIGDRWSHRISVGKADRFLVRGISYFSDDTKSNRGGWTNPYDLRSGWSPGLMGSTGTKLFTLHNTRNVAGLNVWTAPQGATVAGSQTYDFVQDLSVPGRGERWDAVLIRAWGPDDPGHDTPTARGATLDLTGNAILPEAFYMAVLGEPLDAMVSNLGRTDNNDVALGGTDKVLSQGFTTGSSQTGYRLLGIGVNIEGSSSKFPDGPTSVSVSVHEDASGLPGEKLFDLISPTEYGVGHSFFEAPPRTRLGRNTDYVLVWRHLGGTEHLLMRTAENGVDAGAATGSGIADEFYAGPDLSSLAADSAGDALEFAVYTDVAKVPFVAGGVEVRKGWLHIPEDENGEPVVEVGDQFRLLFVTYHGSDATSTNSDDYNDLVQFEAVGRSKRYPEADDISHPVIRSAASEFRAVVCTEAVDARANTGMTGGIGVPIHWLDGGWEEENRPTLIASTYDEFYDDKWTNHDKGAYVTGNTMGFDSNEMIWTGCLSSGASHPEAYMGSSMGMVAVGTPRDTNANNAPLGAVDVDVGYAASETFVEVDGEREPVLMGIYAISPVFTVVE